MAYRTTEHKKAIIKMVRAKRVILQVDLATVMNKNDISSSVESLVKDGKIKRQKVRVRGKVGNLTEMWAVFSNDVRQQEVLDFENGMMNRPFVSPLVINHCYKSVDSPITAETKAEVIVVNKLDSNISESINNNIIDITDYITINSQDVQIKEFKGQRIVSFKEIDAVHERASGTARKRFNDNRDRFIENVDYFFMKPKDSLMSEKRTLEIKIPNRGVTMLTETGYMMLVKTFTDDLSWEVQRQLVNSYFKIQEIKSKQENNILVTNNNTDLSGIYDFMQMFSMVTTDLNNRVKTLEGTIDSMKKAISK